MVASLLLGLLAGSGVLGAASEAARTEEKQRAETRKVLEPLLANLLKAGYVDALQNPEIQRLYKKSGLETVYNAYSQVANSPAYQMTQRLKQRSMEQGLAIQKQVGNLLGRQGNFAGGGGGGAPTGQIPVQPFVQGALPGAAPPALPPPGQAQPQPQQLPAIPGATPTPVTPAQAAPTPPPQQGPVSYPPLRQLPVVPPLNAPQGTAAGQQGLSTPAPPRGGVTTTPAAAPPPGAAQVRNRLGEPAIAKPGGRIRTNLSPQEETSFRNWYRNYSRNNQLNPNPDDPRHKYDYRGWWKAMQTNPREFSPQIDPEDGMMHGPSLFKDPDHPTRFKNGIDTITGQPVSPNRLQPVTGRRTEAPTPLDRDMLTRGFQSFMQANLARAQSSDLKFTFDSTGKVSVTTQAGGAPDQEKVNKILTNAATRFATETGIGLPLAEDLFGRAGIEMPTKIRDSIGRRHFNRRFRELRRAGVGRVEAAQQARDEVGWVPKRFENVTSEEQLSEETKLLALASGNKVTSRSQITPEIAKNIERQRRLLREGTDVTLAKLAAGIPSGTPIDDLTQKQAQDVITMKQKLAQQIKIINSKLSPKERDTLTSGLTALQSVERVLTLYNSKFTGLEAQGPVVSFKRFLGILGTKEADFRAEVQALIAPFRTKFLGSAQTKQELEKVEGFLGGEKLSDREFISSMKALQRYVAREMQALISISQLEPGQAPPEVNRVLQGGGAAPGGGGTPTPPTTIEEKQRQLQQLRQRNQAVQQGGR